MPASKPATLSPAALAKAVKERNDTIRKARQEFTKVVAAAKAKRDTAVSTAELEFMMLVKPEMVAAFQVKAASDEGTDSTGDQTGDQGDNTPAE